MMENKMKEKGCNRAKIRNLNGDLFLNVKEKAMRVSISLSLLVVVLFGYSGIGPHGRVGATHQNKTSQAGRVELTILTVLYSSQVHNQVPTDRFTTGDPITFDTTMTNRTNENVPVGILGGGFVQFRTRLLKVGIPVQYREEIRKTLQDTEDKFYMMGSSVGYTLLPGRPLKIGSFDLKDWYEPLEPGHYELTLKFRFDGKRRPIESNTVTFDVLPAK